MSIKFMWNGIKYNGKLYRAHYCQDCHTPQITVYFKDYDSFPKVLGLNATNDTDTMTDYIVRDIIRITPANPWHQQAQEALAKQAEHNAKRFAKRSA